MKLNNTDQPPRTRLKRTAALLAVCTALTPVSFGTERFFTYTYEPETLPQGAWEMENHFTLASGRTGHGGQDHYHRWEFRTELEYGVTDNYSVSLYVNESYETFRDPAKRLGTRSLSWDGISIENRYLVLNPATHAVGLALYLEPRYDGENFELEQKIILGQRHGDWKWALNLTHATEWSHHFKEKEGEVEISAGLTRMLGKHWAVGLEARDHNEFPEYKIWENSALSIGPVVTYQRANWWATLTVMPQIWGDTFHHQNPDGNRHLELEGHERWNTRLIVGVSF